MSGLDDAYINATGDIAEYAHHPEFGYTQREGAYGKCDKSTLHNGLHLNGKPELIQEKPVYLELLYIYRINIHIINNNTIKFNQQLWLTIRK